jgi:hypothetical protein
MTRVATGQWFSPGTLVSSTNKTYQHDITKILLKVPLNTINNKTKPIKTDIQNSTILLLCKKKLKIPNLLYFKTDSLTFIIVVRIAQLLILHYFIIFRLP